MVSVVGRRLLSEARSLWGQQPWEIGPCPLPLFDSLVCPNTTLNLWRGARGYIANNRGAIPNYGERYRNGEAISSAVAESAVNQVISKRMVKQQQMRWSPRGAHLLLRVRTAALNDDLRGTFCRWYPGMAPAGPPTARRAASAPGLARSPRQRATRQGSAYRSTAPPGVSAERGRTASSDTRQAASHQRIMFSHSTTVTGAPHHGK